MIADLLTRLETEKDRWIEIALNQYVMSLLPSDGKTNTVDQILIGVFGPDRFDKTSFILRLLGAGDRDSDCLAQVLTANEFNFSFIYKWSADDCFHLVYPDQTRAACKNVKELETELQALRKQIEFWLVTYDQPIIVELPRKYLSSRLLTDKREKLSIMNFPGDHDARLLSEYMPLCSACLVAESAPELDGELSEAGHWLPDTGDYYIVLTQSLQTDPVQKAVGSGEITSLEELREFYLRNSVESVHPIFPLDFGRNVVTVSPNAPVWMDALFLELLEEVTGTKSPETRMLEVKSRMRGFFRAKDLQLETLEKKLQDLQENLIACEQSCRQSEDDAAQLFGQVELCEAELTSLKEIEIEKFEASSNEAIGLAPFKERKISKLKESFKQQETSMLDFYEEQAARVSILLKEILQDGFSLRAFDTNPPIGRLALKHGKGLDQYLNLGNFEEDASIVRETLERNNETIFGYYTRQLNDYKEKGQKRLQEQLKVKEEKYEEAAKRGRETQEQQEQYKHKILEAEEQLTEARSVYHHCLESIHNLDDLLKEEFAKAAASLQEKMLAENASDIERWACHNYSQRMLKQAERMMKNDYF
ncbi:hypothetical protein AB1K84_00230 [Mesobacillus foraminis]|uniref:hypothetical protein n=1 Tax=Mesobacillus foraminis TaxID=279826 RepID=UPI0039A2F737